MVQLTTQKKQGRAYGGMSAEQRLAERREKFLRAGLQVFGSQGFRAGTVRVLCKEAGLTDRYFYESFADSEALLKAVYVWQMEHLQRELLQIALRAELSLEQRVHEAVDTFFRAMRDPQRARIALTEVLGVSSSTDALYQSNTQNFGGLIVAQIKLQLPRWSLDAHQEKILGTALAGACAMSAAQWMLEGYASPQDKVVSACELVILGTLQALQAQP
ncbi:MAG: TetR/AcrR family transcriptional regulator [Oceanococcus sp.]